MTDALRPALTPEEWAQGFVDWGLMHAHRGVTLNKHGGVEVYDDTDSADVAPNELPSLIALANHALPEGHPGKLTWEDVEAVTDAARGQEHEFNQSDARLDALAAKLAALLPPR